MRKITFTLLILLISLTAFLPLLSSCGSGEYEYDNAGAYSAGDFERPMAISSLDIEWISGSVEIILYDRSGIYCTESSSESLETETQMHTYFDGDALRIRPCLSGTDRDDVPDKTLTVYVPMGHSFGNLNIRTESASIKTDPVGANFISLRSYSGEIKFEHIGNSRSVRIAGGSADVNYKHAGVSQRTEITSDGGNLIISENEMPLYLSVQSSSGSIEFTLPEDSKLNLEINGEQTASKDGFTSLPKGDGVSEVKLSSGSGSITLKKK